MKMKTLKLGALASLVLVLGIVSCSKKEIVAPKPTISSFAPTSAFEGDTVTIIGTNFTGATAVSFGASSAESFVIENATTIKAVVGAGATGDVKVVTANGEVSLPGFTLKVSAAAAKVDATVSIPFSTSSFLLFSFKDTAVIPNSDSATTKWDIGFRFVTLILNSHASGPGNAGAITQAGLYDDFAAAPSTGYAYDTSSSKRAIDDGLTTGWYSYNPATHAFTPKAGKFFVITTADGKYVKMEITAVDYGGYTPPNPTPTTLIYKFRYSYQADGSRNF